LAGYTVTGDAGSMNVAPSDHPAPNPDRSTPSAARPWSHNNDHVTPADPGPPTDTNGTDAENNPVRSSTDPDNPSPSPIAPDTGPAATADTAPDTTANGTNNTATNADVTTPTSARGRWPGRLGV
jgi:hypothetical protein